MEPIEAYQRLNKGEQIGINDITEEHWKNFDKETFYKTAFKAKNENISKNCTMNVIINHFYYQIINSIPYLKEVLKKSEENRASLEQINSIKEVYNELYGHSLKLCKEKGNSSGNGIKNPAYKAINGF